MGSLIMRASIALILAVALPATACQALLSSPPIPQGGAITWAGGFDGGTCAAHGFVPEDTSTSTVLGTLHEASGETPNSFTYSISSDPDNVVTVAGDQLVLDGMLDYGTASEHDFTWRVSNSAGQYVDVPGCFDVGNNGTDPAVADQTIDFGAKTLALAGKIAPVNTGGAITDTTDLGTGTCSNVASESDGHFWFTTDAAGGNSDGCTIDLSFNSGADTATITVHLVDDEYSVFDGTQFGAALTAALADDSADTTIQGRDGASYGSLGTITATPTHTMTFGCDQHWGCVFSRVTFNGASNFTLEWPKCEQDIVNSQCVLVEGSAGSITIHNPDFKGYTRTDQLNADGDYVVYVGAGVTVKGSDASHPDGVTIYGDTVRPTLAEATCKLTQLGNANEWTTADDVVEHGCALYGVTNNGLFATEVGGCHFYENHIFDMDSGHLPAGSGQHPDPSQFHGSYATLPTTDCEKDHNWVDIGDQQNTQGFFSRCESCGANTALWYANINDHDNVIRNSNPKGIAQYQVNTWSVTNNTLLCVRTYTNRIWSTDSRSTGVTITDNGAPLDPLVAGTATVSGNVKYQCEYPQDDDFEGKIFVNPLKLDSTGRSWWEYAALPGTSMDGKGADWAQWDPTPATPRGWLNDDPDPSDPATVDISIGEIDGPSGAISLSGASVDWDFGDGNTEPGGGISTSHTYAAPGYHDVSALVTLADTSTVTVFKTVVTFDTHEITATFDAGDATDESETANAATVGAGVTFNETLADGDAVRLNGAALSWAWDDWMTNNESATIAAEFKRDDTSQTGKILSSYHGWSLDISGTTLECQMHIDSSTAETVTTTVPNDTSPHSAVCVFDGSAGTFTFYLDDSSVGQVTGLTGDRQFATSNNGFYVGHSSTSRFPGLIDNVHLDRYPWTAQDALDYYNAMENALGGWVMFIGFLPAWRRRAANDNSRQRRAA